VHIRYLCRCLGAGQSKLRVSVVTPVRNRKELLRELIESLWAQSLDTSSFEIVIVDDCSTDGTPAVLEELQARSPCPLVYRALTPHAGSVRARNEGVRLAQAPVLAFTDSDCRATPRWLELGLAALEAHPDVAFVTGPTLNKPDQPVTFFSVGGNPRPRDNPIYPLTNAFYRKDVFWEVGGFDESIWLGAVKTTPVEYSDIDLAYRVLGRGYRNAFVDELIVYHEVLQVSPWHWLMWNLRLVQLPELLGRYPVLRKSLLWKGPFLSPIHAWFYLGVLGVLAAGVTSGWLALLVLPYLCRSAIAPGRGLSMRTLLRAPARLVLLTLRQVFVSAFLLWGSVRARNMVL